MRIVSGQFRGRPIEAPEGRDTRPTQDRVRESIASIVYSDRGGVEGASVLDAFAGSGAMSFELLSRGAAHATMCDADARAIRCIRGNAERLGVDRGAVSVLRGDAFALARRGRLPGARFDVVFLDPPYATDVSEVAGLVEALGRGGMLADGALVVYERDARGPELRADVLAAVSSRSVGTVGVDVSHWIGREGL